MKLNYSGRALIILLLAFGGWYIFLRKPSFAWHQGPKWEKFLKFYDELAKDLFHECNSSLISIKFGSTQVYTCGEYSNPPVLFFHSGGSNYLMYGDWLMPRLRNTHFSVAVDYPCDAGRSSPREGDTKNCPKTQEEFAEWAKEILKNLSIEDRRVSMVAYSYGTLISSSIALVAPQIVDKLVFIAPAGLLHLSKALSY